MRHIDKLAVSVAKINNIYTYKGTEYIVIGDSDKDTERLIQDFKYCESIKDYNTIRNRIINGVKWGWLKQVNS